MNDTELNRLRELSGLEQTYNTTVTVREGLELSKEQKLTKLLELVEASIVGAERALVQYAELVGKLESQMSEEQQLHFTYGILAMSEEMEEAAKRMAKLA